MKILDGHVLYRLTHIHNAERTGPNSLGTEALIKLFMQILLSLIATTDGNQPHALFQREIWYQSGRYKPSYDRMPPTHDRRMRWSVKCCHTEIHWGQVSGAYNYHRVSYCYEALVQVRCVTCQVFKQRVRSIRNTEQEKKEGIEKPRQLWKNML